MFFSLRGALRRLAAAKRRPEESARRLDAAWPRLFERFLHVTAHPGDPVFAATLRHTLENFVRRYGDLNIGDNAEATPRLEESYQRHLAGLLGQLPGYEIIEQGVPGVRGRFDVLVRDAAGRDHLLELKVDRPSSRSSLLEDAASQLDRYLDDLAAHHRIRRPDGHLICFDIRPQPRGAGDVEREADIHGHAVWRVHVNRRRASERSA